MFNLQARVAKGSQFGHLPQDIVVRPLKNYIILIFSEIDNIAPTRWKRWVSRQKTGPAAVFWFSEWKSNSIIRHTICLL